MIRAILLTLAVLLALPVQADNASATAASTPAADQPAGRDFMLTFDDGPVPGKTERVLATLAQLHAPDGSPLKAAFFMVGDAPDNFFVGRKYYAPYEIWIHKGSAHANPELVAKVRAAGHFVGNHTAHHAWFRWPWLSSEDAVIGELQRWEAETNPPADQPKLFRPPYLIETHAVKAAARKLGYQIVDGYTVGDASPIGTLYSVKQNALHYLQTAPDTGRPLVLIFHDIMPITYEHLGEIVEFLQQHGMRPVSFDPSLLADPALDDQPMTAPQQHYIGNPG